MSNPVKKTIQELLVQRRHRLYEEQLVKQALPRDTWLKAMLEEERTELLKWHGDAERSGHRQLPEIPHLSVEIFSWEDFYRYTFTDSGLPGAISPGSVLPGENTPKTLSDIWIVTPLPSCLIPDAALEVERYFVEHPSCGIAYGDEDGYFKPDWSPDLLQSFFYFGNMFAVRRTLAEKVIAGHKAAQDADPYSPEPAPDPKAPAGSAAILLKQYIYEFVLCCVDEAREAGHIEKILFLQDYPAGNPSAFADYRTRQIGEATILAERLCTDWGAEPEFDELKKGHLYSDTEIPSEKGKQELVSVIIPSKDNPQVLSTCIHSLLLKTAYRNMEILVIDNGSREENRQQVLALQQQIQRQMQQEKESFSFQYIYRPMAFNFSAMCNLGARKASGKYLLFLNDDIEIVRPEWLSVLISKGAKDYLGAVGAKLLYPGSDKIQHVGVTNIHLGPAHKLQFASDRETYYHGFNHCAVNVSAVTGACLLIRKAVFEEIGGFEEELQVAFNDVELCYHLLQAGYKNVCCNQTYLYHHESLSRGSDDGEEKVARLHRERDFLYAAYPEMWNRDAYYSRKLVTDVLDRGFEPACRFQESRISRKATPVLFKGKLHPAWHNKTLFMGLEFTGDEMAWRTGKPGGGDYYMQGWSYALHVDNSRYKKSLLLKMVEGSHTPDQQKAQDVPHRQDAPCCQQTSLPRLWKIPYEGCYRPDFQENMTHIDHPALCGVSVWISRDALPAGEYLIGYFWEDTCSRQKLYGFTAEKIQIVL